MIVVGPEEADPPDDDGVFITGDMGNNGAGDENIDRISLLKDIYTTTRTMEDDPGPQRVQRGTGQRVSHSHCLIGFRFGREHDRTEPVDRLDEWIKEVKSFSTTSAVQPRRDVISYTELGARPKVSSDPRMQPMSVEGRNKESAPIPLVTVDRPRQEIWNQLGDMGRKIEAIPTATDAITRVKERVRKRMRLHVTGTNDTTQVKNHIFEWKDIGGKMPSDSPRR